MSTPEQQFSFSRRMLLAFARSHHVRQARELALGYCTKAELPACNRLFRHLERVPEWSHEELIRYIDSNGPPVSIELTVLWFLRFQLEHQPRNRMAVVRKVCSRFRGFQVLDHEFALCDGIFA